MSVPDIKSPPTYLKRIPLSRIDAVVSAHLGPARVENKEQPAVFNRQIAMFLAKHVSEWSATAIGRFYHGRDHSALCYSIQRIKILREVSHEVDELLRKLEEALRNPERFDFLSIDRPASIRVDKLREDVLLDKLAERIALRVARLLGGADNSARPNSTGEIAVQANHSSELKTLINAATNA